MFKLSLIVFILEILDISIFSEIQSYTTDDEVDTKEASKNKEEKQKNVSTDADKDIARVSTSTDAGEEEYYTFKVKKGIVDKILDKVNKL